MSFVPTQHWMLTFILACTITAAVQVFYHRKTNPRKKLDRKLCRSRSNTKRNQWLPHDPDLDKRKPASRWETVIFFPSIAQGVMKRSSRQMLPDLSLVPESLFKQVAFFFEQAQKSIQICALLLSEFELANVILRKKNRGVAIQLITDHDTINELQTGMNNTSRHFSKVGIPVRTKNSQHLMHNKYVIIDREAVLTGSLNFTKRVSLQ